MNYKEQYVYAYRNFIKRDGSESLLNGGGEVPVRSWGEIRVPDQ